MNINSEFTKYLLLALTFQWWFPFLKAIWDDFNDALREEGGILGMAPPKKRLEEMDRELGEYETTLRSEPHAPPVGGRQARSPGPPGAGAPPGARGPVRPGGQPRRRGFR